MTESPSVATPPQPLSGSQWLLMALFAAGGVWTIMVAVSALSSRPQDVPLFFGVGLMLLGTALESPYMLPAGKAALANPARRDHWLKLLADRLHAMSFGVLLLWLLLRWGVDWPVPQSMPTCP